MVLTKEDLLAIEGLFAGRFESIDNRFISIDERFDAMDQRLDAMDRRLEHVESDVASLKVGQSQLNKRLKEVSDKVNGTYELALDNWGQIEESKMRLSFLEG